MHTSSVTSTTPAATLAPNGRPIPPTTSSTADAVSAELQFGKHIVRAVHANGTLWFAAPDLVDALGWTERTLDVAKSSPMIPPYCRSSGQELPDVELEGEPDSAVTLLSPIGVWLWTEAVDAIRGQKVAAWSKNQARDLVPDAARGDPATFLALMPDGKLPPYPAKYSGRKTEWIELRERHRELSWQRHRQPN